MKMIELLLLRLNVAIFLLLGSFVGAGSAAAFPVSFVDSSGSQLTISERPQKIVSLVPAVTEIILQLGAGDSLKGLTYHDTIHDTLPPEANHKELVGGFLAPSLARIEAIQPQVIFLASLHREVRDRFAGRPWQMVQLDAHSVADLYRNIQVLGAIFDQEEKAKEIVQKIQSELQLISTKVAKVPREKRKRVMRFMGQDRVMTPGDDSFQNEFIRAAGGHPSRTGQGRKRG